MKTIRIYALHPYCKDLSSAIDYLLLEKIKDKYEFVWAPDSPDYLIATEHIYSDNRYYKQFLKLASIAKIRIFWAGEAIEPDFNVFDYAVGFSSSLQHGDRFAQLPSPYVFPGAIFIDAVENDITDIAQARRELQAKRGFCNFLYSNSNAHPNRDKLFHIISSYKRIDSLGRHLNNIGRLGTGYVGHSMDCIGIKRAYKFSIASENACFAGYTSEKILSSLAAHTVPIYWGDPDIGLNVNPNCFINCNKFSDWNEVVSAVRKIDEDDNLWCEMVAAPWRTDVQRKYHEQRDENYISFFENIFSQDVVSAKRIGEGTFLSIYRDTFNRIKFPSTFLPYRIARFFYRSIVKHIK